MESPILEMIGIAIVTLLTAALLGLLLQKGCGVALLVITAALAAGACIAAFAYADTTGLLASILVVALFGAIVGYKLGKGRGAALVSLLWLGFCLSCVIGFQLGGRTGLLTITLPANILLWLALFVFSGFLLPLKDAGHRLQAFRSLLTYSLGTNYPYYVAENRHLDPRVQGSPFRKFLAGPGIVITNCDHVVVTSTGTDLREPEEPGLRFTGRFEVVKHLVDLRPQLRTFDVDARTLDGIGVRVNTHACFRMRWGGQRPVPDKSFPVQGRAILQALTREVVEGHARRRTWDEYVEIRATRILQDIISCYKFNELCLALGPDVGRTTDSASGSSSPRSPDDIVQRYEDDKQPSPCDPTQDPRLRIQDALSERLTKEMKRRGIELTGVILGDLAPADPGPRQQRIKNWQTKWKGQITRMEAERDARRVEMVDNTRASVEDRLMLVLAKMLSKSKAEGKNITDAFVAATFIASLERMTENPDVKELLSEDTRQKMIYLRSQGRALSPPTPPPKGPED